MQVRTSFLRNRLVFASAHHSTGAALINALLVMAVLTVLGIATITITAIEIQISRNYHSAREAFYAAEAGIEHGREALRALNATSTDPRLFTDELDQRRGENGVIDGYTEETDDVPLIARSALGNSFYTVYLTNDILDGASNPIDTNGQVTLTSVATGPHNSQAIIESTVSLYRLFPFPATITLLGTGAIFAGGSSVTKEFRGDDQCGTDPPRPVVAASDPADIDNIRHNITTTKPTTYLTQDESGNVVQATTHPDYISREIEPEELSDMSTTSGIDLLDPGALNQLVTTLQTWAHTVAPNGSSASTVNVGTSENPQVVVVTGDFDLNNDGVGLLVVTGNLTFRGHINYSGVILVIGAGYVQRIGTGSGRIQGGILVANTRGPDNLLGTADDDTVLGPPTFDSSGPGDTSIVYCSTAIANALAAVPLRIVAFKHLY